MEWILTLVHRVSKVDEGKIEWKKLDVVEAMEKNGKCLYDKH
jgi:hypothetical protein